MNNTLKKIITVFISLFLLAYVAYQIYLTAYFPVATQKALLQTVDDSIKAKGYVINDEQIIKFQNSGILDYAVDDGSKVAKGGVVANVYPDSQQAENERKIRELDNKISQLELNSVNGNTSITDIDVLNGEINQKFTLLSQLSQSGGVESIGSLESDFLNLLNQKQIATGQASGFAAELQQLQQERDSLAGQQSKNVTSVTSPASGYFISKTDGLENRFPIKDVMTITPEQVDSLLSAKPSGVSGSIGKIETSFEWYIVCNLSKSDTMKLKINGQASFSIPLSSESGIPVTVVAENKSGDRYAVVLQCSYMTGDLVGLRNSDVNIIINSYSGIKVDNNSVHQVNGTNGVYILMGNTAQFKKLDILYYGDGFVLSRLDPADQNKLQLYDEVIVEGKNIYDGKIVK